MSKHKPHHRHDKFFKQAMGFKRVALEFFRWLLPPKIVSSLDLRTLEASKDSFVAEGNQATYVDIVFRAKFRGHSQYCIFPCEHKSEIE